MKLILSEAAAAVSFAFIVAVVWAVCFVVLP